MKQWQRKLFSNTVHVYMLLADTKCYVSIKLMAVIGNLRYFTVSGTFKKQTYITRHLLWDTLEINWSSLQLKYNSTEVTNFSDCTPHG